MTSDGAPLSEARPPEGASRGPLIFLLACEESGDRLGAALIEALRQRIDAAVRFAGIGGTAMAGQGIAEQFPMHALSIVGLGIIKKQPQIWYHIWTTAQAVIAAKPDVLVIIDGPDFTHWVARIVRLRAPHIPIVDYVSPSVWAWRPWRARAMRRYVDHVLALLPFEPAAHAELGGPPCSFVGHPLGEAVALLRPNAAEAQRRMAEPPIVLVLPGSRSGEIRRMLPMFEQVIDRLTGRAGLMQLVMPSVQRHADALRAATATWRVRPHIVVDPQERHSAFRTARAALAKSGTVTLELALAGVPMVTAYKVSAVEGFIGRRMIRVPSVILANLVLDDKVVPEFIQENCTVDALTDALAPLLADTPQRRQQVEAFARLDGIMQIGMAHPSARAAAIVLDVAARGRR